VDGRRTPGSASANRDGRCGIGSYWLLAEAHLQLYYLTPPYNQGQ
jgi:hypothetical protein